MEIAWPSLTKNFSESDCASTVTTEISYLGVNGLSALWAKQDFEKAKTVVNLLEKSVKGLKADKVVITRVTATLKRDSVDTTDTTPLATAKFDFTIKFEAPEQPVEEQAEEEQQPAEEELESAVANEANFNAFAGYIVEAKEVKAPTAGPAVIPDPIRTKI